LEQLTVQEYLEEEQHSAIRHELVDSHAYAMVGASSVHNLLAGTLFAALHTHLRGNPCRVFMSDMKVRTGQDFYYPDILVTCETFDPKTLFQTAPILIIEVLSDSTERTDRHEKRLAYQRFDSLKEYVLVAQDRMEVEIYRRIENGWKIERLEARDILHFESVGFTMPVAKIYRDVLDAES
jgi:Uma2 family endonuclease